MIQYIYSGCDINFQLILTLMFDFRGDDPIFRLVQRSGLRLSSAAILNRNPFLEFTFSIAGVCHGTVETKQKVHRP